MSEQAMTAGTPVSIARDIPDMSAWNTSGRDMRYRRGQRGVIVQVHVDPHDPDWYRYPYRVELEDGQVGCFAAGDLHV